MEDVEKSFSSVEPAQLSTEALMKLQTRPNRFMYILGRLKYPKRDLSARIPRYIVQAYKFTHMGNIAGMGELVYCLQET